MKTAARLPADLLDALDPVQKVCPVLFFFGGAVTSFPPASQSVLHYARLNSS